MARDLDLKKLSSEKLVEQAVAALRSLVLSGQYGDGGVLPSQGELCVNLGVSRSVIREAMRTLQSEGLLEVSQGRRPRVCPAGPSAVIRSLSTLVERTDVSLLQVVEIRKLLEVEAAALAARNVRPEQLARLERTVTDLATATDREGQIVADLAFHAVLAEASGNPLFSAILAAFAELLYESRRLTLNVSGVETALVYHRRILAAVQQSDPSLAAQAMREHMETTRKDIERIADNGAPSRETGP